PFLAQSDFSIFNDFPVVLESYTHAEIHETLHKVASQSAPRFMFGMWEEEDIYQQAYMFGIDGLSRYNGGHPLENFIRIHVRNRLRNLKRDNYLRPQAKKETQEKKLA